MKKNNYSGKFIVIEGLDGSGQSTQTALLKDFVVNKGYEAVLTKEPTPDSEAGKKIRQVLDKNTQVSPMYLQELFAKDRKEHLEKLIIPALKDGKIVISDRYFFSSFACGVASGAGLLEELIKLNSKFPMPDLSIILKVRPEVCMERIRKRGEPQTLFEETEKLRKVWQVYEILPERLQKVYIIDGERPIEDVFGEVKNLVHSKFGL